MKLAAVALLTIATLAVAAASSIGAVQSRPDIQTGGPEVTSAIPEASFVPESGADVGPGIGSTKRPNLSNSVIDAIGTIAKGFGIGEGSIPFGGLGYNPGIGRLGNGGALGLTSGLGDAGLGGLGYGTGLENIYGSLLGSGNLGFLEAGPILGLGGGRGGTGYTSVKTYNRNYNFDSDDPSNGAKQTS